jgi:hypothetical protein
VREPGQQPLALGLKQQVEQISDPINGQSMLQVCEVTKEDLNCIKNGDNCPASETQAKGTGERAKKVSSNLTSVLEASLQHAQG